MILQRLGRLLFAGALSGALLVGTMTLATPPAQAAVGAHPILLCGPSFQWSCSGVGGPSYPFFAPICMKHRFGRRTGLTCTPL